MHPSPDPGPLMAVVTAADADLAERAVDGAVLQVGDPAAAPRYRYRPLEGRHPLEVLMGFVAPRHWRALGVSCPGRALSLDPEGRPQRGPAGRPPAPITVTVLFDRGGGAAGVMRRGGEVTSLTGQPEGVVADACRRALGLPTAPPPPSTLGLWTLTWLDRLVEVAGQADAASRLRTWPAVAALHAAGMPGTGPGATASPAELVASARLLAEAWPWSRLRREPRAADVPGPPTSADLAAWMDDGMWARWLLARLPAADDLLAGVQALLPPVLSEGVIAVARATWG